MGAPRTLSLEELKLQIQTAIRSEPLQPWCVHRLAESILAPDDPDVRTSAVLRTENAANVLTDEGKARRETVSAVTIGVHCQDTLYWSPEATQKALEDFGPEYESPAVLRRLASHMYCHGL